MIKQRKSNIELLRILCGLSVVILHYINGEIGGGLNYVISGTANYYILLYLESLLCCAVNIFILISGYFLSTSQMRNVTRIIQLFAQVVLINTGGYLLKVVLGSTLFSFRHLVNAILPDNYFVILYSVLFLLSPYMNILIKQLGKKKMKNLLLMIFFFFSIWAIGVDVLEEIKGDSIVGLSAVGIWENQEGYTIVNFIMMYFIGAYIHFIDLKKINKLKIAVLLFFNLIIITIWGYFNVTTAWEYCNPLVILEAVLIFILFLNLEFKYSKVINGLSKEVFSVFLLHSFFIKRIGIENAVIGNSLEMCLHIIVSSVGIFLVCWCLGKMYNLFTEPILKKIEIFWDIDKD